MLAKNDVSKTFWREVVNTIVYSMNRVQFKDTHKTPYEIWFGHSPIVKYFIIFGSKCYIKKMIILVILMLEVMKVCFLVIH